MLKIKNHNMKILIHPRVDRARMLTAPPVLRCQMETAKIDSVSYVVLISILSNINGNEGEADKSSQKITVKMIHRVWNIQI